MLKCVVSHERGPNDEGVVAVLRRGGANRRVKKGELLQKTEQCLGRGASLFLPFATFSGLGSTQHNSTSSLACGDVNQRALRPSVDHATNRFFLLKLNVSTTTIGSKPQ